MYLMYVDECGDCGLAPGSSRYFVLSGFVLHEAYWEESVKRIEDLREKLESKYGFSRKQELHAGEMIGRSAKRYSHIPKSDRVLIFRDVLSFESSLSNVRLIHVVVDKSKNSCTDPFSIAWDTLINRFENTIEYGNFPNPHGNNKLNYIEKGLLIVDETDEPKLRSLIRTMRTKNLIPSFINPGTTVRHDLKCIIEDPLHKQSSWSHFIQLCDTNSYFLKQTLEPNATVLKHGARNYFYKLEPILLKAASTKNRYGIVFR